MSDRLRGARVLRAARFLRAGRILRAARLHSDRGQSSVEIVALLPLLVFVAMTVLQLLAAGAAVELADHAAEAGAVAMLQQRDPEQAVLDALPGWSRDRVTITVRDRRVRVRVRPPALTRSLAERLAATAEADAGRKP